MLTKDIEHVAASYPSAVQTPGRVEGVQRARPSLTLQVGSALDPGIKRRQEPNEDTLSIIQGVIPSLSWQPFALFMVADGMGGQADGREASELAVQSLSKFMSNALNFQQVKPEDLLPLLEAGVRSANQVLYHRNQERYRSMGTTMTAAFLVGDTAYVAHVGDSRCYLFREGVGLSQITLDHSLVAALVAAGMVRAEDIYTHPRRNIIYRYLGEKSKVAVDTYTVPLVRGDILLLCSDGLWEMVRDSEIAALLTSPAHDSSQIAQALVQAALAGGGEDNVSAIVARVMSAFC
ncbi:MAG TPA: protein phosphatase 2C domain-containing protein [Ktedonobacteraceae bacterium]|nr:protein phosphatase 2C domain-containing protein [Ktedonobacteraceae bacterium]